MHTVRGKLEKRPKISKLLIRHERLRRKLSQSQELVLSKTQVKEGYISRTKEIDNLWIEGKIEESLDKVIELYDFLDFHGAIELRMNYCHPVSGQSII